MKQKQSKPVTAVQFDFVIRNNNNDSLWQHASGGVIHIKAQSLADAIDIATKKYGFDNGNDNTQVIFTRLGILQELVDLYIKVGMLRQASTNVTRELDEAIAEAHAKQNFVSSLLLVPDEELQNPSAPSAQPTNDSADIRF